MLLIEKVQGTFPCCECAGEVLVWQSHGGLCPGRSPVMRDT